MGFCYTCRLLVCKVSFGPVAAFTWAGGVALIAFHTALSVAHLEEMGRARLSRLLYLVMSSYPSAFLAAAPHSGWGCRL